MPFEKIKLKKETKNTLRPILNTQTGSEMCHANLFYGLFYMYL